MSTNTEQTKRDEPGMIYPYQYSLNDFIYLWDDKETEMNPSNNRHESTKKPSVTRAQELVTVKSPLCETEDENEDILKELNSLRICDVVESNTPLGNKSTSNEWKLQGSSSTIDWYHHKDENKENVEPGCKDVLDNDSRPQFLSPLFKQGRRKNATILGERNNNSSVLVVPTIDWSNDTRPRHSNDLEFSFTNSFCKKNEEKQQVRYKMSTYDDKHYNFGICSSSSSIKSVDSEKLDQSDYKFDCRLIVSDDDYDEYSIEEDDDSELLELLEIAKQNRCDYDESKYSSDIVQEHDGRTNPTAPIPTKLVCPIPRYASDDNEHYTDIVHTLCCAADQDYLDKLMCGISWSCLRSKSFNVTNVVED